MKTMSLIKLYELGKVSLGMAAKLLNLKRTEFLEVLGKYHVSYFQSDLDDGLKSEFSNQMNGT